MTDHPLLRAVHRVGGATLLLAAMLACSADDGGIGADTSATASAATAAADDTMEERLITVDTTLAEYARYTGELPCDDCEAVRTELRLWTDPHRYLLRETYVGRAAGDTTLVRVGEWLELRGTPADTSARLVQLRLESAGPPRYFVMIGGNGASPGTELRQLDERQQPMPDPARWTLRRE